MDYEKKYKKALERARELLDSPRTCFDIVQLKDIFPQLRESEDERIRGARDAIEGAIRVYGKTQGEWIGGYDMDTLVVHLREAFGALEKQKEQKPSTGIYWHAIKKGDKIPCRAYLYKVAYETENNFRGRATIDGLLVPNIENVTCGCDTWYLPADDVKNLPREGLDELQKEQKPAWSEEDADILNCCISSIEEAKAPWALLGLVWPVTLLPFLVYCLWYKKKKTE